MNTVRPSAAIVADSQAGDDATIWFVTDRRLNAAALAALLLKDSRYLLQQNVRGSAGLREAFRMNPPRIVVADTAWSSWLPGIDAENWAGRVLLLVDPAAEASTIVRAARAGVNGYLSRAGSGESLALAIDAVRRFGHYLDPSLGERIILALREGAPLDRVEPALSDHERDILVRVASGRSSKEIAREYAITPKTVGNHVANICKKLHLSHRGELVLYAARAGLAMPDSPTHGTTIPFKSTAEVR